jgi:hypothetical protein
MPEAGSQELADLRSTLQMVSAICDAAKVGAEGYFTLDPSTANVPMLSVSLRLAREVATVAQDLPGLVERVEATVVEAAVASGMQPQRSLPRPPWQ